MLFTRVMQRLSALRLHLHGDSKFSAADLLAQERIERILAELGVVYRERIYTPVVTLWMFLGQVLSADASCANAVARFLALRTARGERPCSSDSGCYCEARQKLPEELLSRLVQETGQELSEQTTAWRFHGRSVKVVDGTTVSMSDSEENSKVFDKPRNQHGVSAFPVARLLVVFCLASGAALELVLGPFRGKATGELSLFRSLKHAFQKGEIILGDRLFCTFFDIARLLAQGVDVVFRLSAARKADFRRGRRLGPNDHVVVWRKPKVCPKWMSPHDFLEAPATITLREVRVRVNIRGFRVKSLVVVTSLLDPAEFSATELVQLFRQRWHAELDLRSLKTVMQMDVLRCRTPPMVRKEIWMHLLAYNLLRGLMSAAAEAKGCTPREVSFKGTLQLFNAFYHLVVTSTAAELECICSRLLKAIAEHRVGNRPDRYEPRKLRRPPKPFPRFRGTREEERKKCA